eukprot:GHVR01160899.1.p1 GENE.GHVR01160899.1~~GHVR01160899.1.p1  ORF type:complete len:327 (+),score=46.24 GHVR01160899.1:1202-2182(+)
MRPFEKLAISQFEEPKLIQLISAGVLCAVFFWPLLFTYVSLDLFLFLCRKPTLSLTAGWILRLRATYHLAGVRKDTLSLSLLESLGFFPIWILRLHVMILQFIGAVSGVQMVRYSFPFRAFDHVLMRSRFIDKHILSKLPAASQLCVLGAGFDVRCCVLGSSNKKDKKFFEVDRPEVQKYKKMKLESVCADTSGIVFVPLDFEKDKWVENLHRHGFSSKKKTIFIMEGLLYYLRVDQVKGLLTTVKEHCAPGSVVLFDYFNGSFLKRKVVVGPLLKRLGEELKWSVGGEDDGTRELTIKDLMGEVGLKLTDHLPTGVVGGVVAVRT